MPQSYPTERERLDEEARRCLEGINTDGSYIVMPMNETDLMRQRGRYGPSGAVGKRLPFRPRVQRFGDVLYVMKSPHQP